jgi:glycosyltransferase involved in cell wall biosynthesis
MYREFNAKMAKLAPKNVEHIHDCMGINELRNLMLTAHVSLGQLADHSRLDRTLPCKLFESLALKLPYLTGRNEAVFELFTENENCFAVNPGDADDLAQKIFYLKKNHELVTRVGDAGYALYQERMMSKKLADDVMRAIFP